MRLRQAACLTVILRRDAPFFISTQESTSPSFACAEIYRSHSALLLTPSP